MNSKASSFRPRLMFCITCFVILALGSVAESDAHARGPAQTARLDHPFTVRAGQQVTLKGEGLRIKFVAVKGDSRCPADVTCVWAGNAAVQIDLSAGLSGGKSLTLNTGRSPSPVDDEYRGYKVKLVELKPYPVSSQKIAAGDYIVTLLVRKLGRKSSGNGSTEKLILELEKQGREATLNNDIEANDRLLANNWLNINPDGSVTTKAQLMELLRGGAFKITSIENDEVLVRTYGEMAVVTGRSTTRRAGAGNQTISRQVRFTRVYDGSAGRWQVVSAHNTLITPR